MHGLMRPGSLRNGVRHAVDVARRGREAGAGAARRGRGEARRDARCDARCGLGEGAQSVQRGVCMARLGLPARGAALVCPLVRGVMCII